MSASVAEVLSQLETRGVKFALEADETVRVHAPRGALAPDEIAELRRLKPDVVAHLRQRQLAVTACKAIEADGLTLQPDDLLDALAPSDFADADLWQPDALRTLARCIAEERQRQAGTIPPTHTARVTCLRCGEVWLPPGSSPRNNCPWCFNRISGRTIPR